MTELQPTDGHVNGGGQLPLVRANTNNDPAGPATKRQRRPSVRLGDINDSNHLLPRRPKTHQHQWKQLPLKDSAAKPSKTRPLVNVSKSDGNDKINNKNLDSVAIGSWKLSNSSKSRKAGQTPLKRVRSNWGSKTDDDDKYSNDADVDDGLDFDRGGSDSELKEQTPIQSLDTGHNNNRRGGDVRVRVSDGVELDGPSDTDARNWNNNNSERNCVRVWLNQLGLGRYAPVFEVHEVDEEILPLLTLEDLKDMGISAVGSRRKMYCSIQKLGKGFS